MAWLHVGNNGYKCTRLLTIYMEKLEISDGNSNGSPHSVREASTLFRGCLHEKTRTGASFIPRWLLTVAGLAQSIERFTAKREVAGSIPGAGPLLRVLKWLRNEGTFFALQTARPSRGSDDLVKYSVPN